MPPGSPNLFKPDVARNLNRVFPPQFGGFDVPTVLSGVVQLTHDVPGTLPHASPSLFEVIGTIDVTLISTALTPPDGFIWIVDECSVLANNEPTARRLRMYLNYATSIGTFSQTIFTTDWPTGGIYFPIHVGRRFIMPPQSVLNLTINTLTAGGNLRLTFAYNQVPAGQFVPKN